MGKALSCSELNAYFRHPTFFTVFSRLQPSLRRQKKKKKQETEGRAGADRVRAEMMIGEDNDMKKGTCKSYRLWTSLVPAELISPKNDIKRQLNLPLKRHMGIV